MTHPLTPPPELVEEWIEQFKGDHPIYVAMQAAQWGADQELEACCEWLANETPEPYIKALRAARRPKPLSLKELALIHFESYAATFETAGGDSDLIRRALEALPDD